MNEKTTRRDAKAIQALFPAAKHVVLAEGLEFDARVLNVGQVAKIGKLLGPELMRLRGFDGLRTAIFEHGDLFLAAVAIAIDWDEADVFALPPDLFFRVIEAIIDVNAEHFQDRIAPALERLFAETVKAAESEAAE